MANRTRDEEGGYSTSGFKGEVKPVGGVTLKRGSWRAEDCKGYSLLCPQHVWMSILIETYTKQMSYCRAVRNDIF